MFSKKIIIICLTFFTIEGFSKDITKFKIPFGSVRLNNTADGTIVVNLDTPLESKIDITKEFYGVDTHGFSKLPDVQLVTPLQLGYVKLGGSLHATYNWELNAYFDNQEVSYVYSPLTKRLNYIETGYKALPIFQVNMLGWQPAINSEGKIVFQNSANAEHAAKAITYLNGIKKIGLKHIVMGNEPFDSEEYNDVHIPTADEYIDKYIEYAMALREAQEKISGNANDIKLWGPELATGWTGWQTNQSSDCVFDYEKIDKVICSYGNGKFTEFIPYFLARLTEFEKNTVKNPKGHKLLDYLTFHYYPLFRTEFQDPKSILRDQDGNQNIAAMLEAVNVWNTKNYVNIYDGASPKQKVSNIIEKFQNWRQQYYPSSKIAVTEFSIDSIDKIPYHPIVRPLYLADLIGRAASAGLDNFIYSFLQTGNSSSDWAMIDRNEKTHIFNVFYLFSNFFIGKTIQSTDTFGDLVNSYTVETKSGINIFIVNKDNAPHTTKLEFSKIKAFQTISFLDLPAWSVTLMTIPYDHTKEILVHQYGAKEMGIKIDMKTE